MKENSKFFKSSEEVISMFLGLLIVVVVVGLVINFVQRNKGVVDLEGLMDFGGQSEKVTEVAEQLTPAKVNEEGKQVEGKGVVGQSEGKELYTVVRGDSLSKLAKQKYGDFKKWTIIATANNIKNPEVILVGQKIIIPAIIGESKIQSSTETRTIVAGERYKVVKGDSLWKIAVIAYGDGYRWVDIWKANKSVIVDPGVLYVDSVLVVPATK